MLREKPQQQPLVPPVTNKISHLTKSSLGKSAGLTVGPTPRAPNTHDSRTRSSIPQQQLVFGSSMSGGGQPKETSSQHSTAVTNHNHNAASSYPKSKQQQ